MLNRFLNGTNAKLTPAILELSEGKLCGLFISMPSHVKTVTFDFTNLQPNQLEAVERLMAHAAYAKNVNRFYLVAPADKSMADVLESRFKQFNSNTTIEKSACPAPALR
jgi:hypothetical protein